MSKTDDGEFPRRGEWQDYFSGHGVDIERRFVELPNDAYWVYRVECAAADLTVQSQTLENALAMMIAELVETDGGVGDE